MTAPFPRPQVRTYSIEDLVALAHRGSIRVPAFQRRFRWTREDVVELFDSIYRGFPIGALLFWERQAPADRLAWGPVTIDAPAQADALWVVDGQQRISSLVGALMHATSGGASKGDGFQIHFDLEKEEFLPSRRRPPPAHHLPLCELLDSGRLLAWLEHYPDRERRKEITLAAMRLSRAVREYLVPAYVVQTADDALIRDMFGRLNSAGKPLRAEEVFNALHGGMSGRQPSDLGSLEKSVADLGFGTIEQRWLLKAVLAIGGKDVTQIATAQRRVERLGDLLPQTERAMKATVVFLRRDARVSTLELLPYRTPLVVLAKFFALHPEPLQRSRDLLARWLWRGAVTGHHRGEAIQLREGLDAIDTDEEESVQRLLGQISKETPTSLGLAPYRFRSAQTKIELNALTALNPRSLLSGRSFDAPRLLQELRGEALATFSLPGLRSATLASRLLYPPPSRGDLNLDFISDWNPEHLAAHAISREAWDALRAERHGDFLRLRGESLARQVSTFVASRTRWGESDRKSIQALVVAEDTDP